MKITGFVSIRYRVWRGFSFCCPRAGIIPMSIARQKDIGVLFCIHNTIRIVFVYLILNETLCSTLDSGTDDDVIGVAAI